MGLFLENGLNAIASLEASKMKRFLIAKAKARKNE